MEALSKQSFLLLEIYAFYETGNNSFLVVARWMVIGYVLGTDVKLMSITHG
jgi:hypothetical protein